MRTDFMFTMDELKRAAGGNIADREIHVNISIFDWNLLINRTGSASAYVYSRKITLKFLGDPIRTFKPGMPFKVYVSSLLDIDLFLICNSSPLNND